jgi:predicted GNAT family N-acyltransferase
MISIRKITTTEDLQKCLQIRKKVFIEGQNVPPDEEIDGKDQDSEHYLLCLNEAPAGVARVRFVENFAKIERVAILDEYQGQGLGKEIMHKILADLQENKFVDMAKLSSQTHAIPFYEKLGFVVCSEEYLDANIPHKDMKLIFAR